MSYKENSGAKFLKLKNFLRIDMAPFVNPKFNDSGRNPFHMEKGEDQFSYQLTALIVYSEKNSIRDGYETLVRQKDESWLKISKHSMEYLSQQEVEEIHKPSLLLYKREFEVGSERSNLRSHLEILNMTRYRGNLK